MLMHEVRLQRKSFRYITATLVVYFDDPPEPLFRPMRSRSSRSKLVSAGFTLHPTGNVEAWPAVSQGCLASAL
jgi:hypothetical protein